MLDELLDDMTAEEVESVSVYRDAELKMMAENLLSSIESGKTDVSALHRHNFFKTGLFTSLRLMSITANNGDPNHIDTFAVNVLLRSIYQLPYVNEVVAKYLKEEKHVELFRGLSSAVSKEPSAVVNMLYEQMESFQKLVESLPAGMVKCNIRAFKPGMGDRISKTMKVNNSRVDISLDAVTSLPTDDMTEVVEYIGAPQLKKTDVVNYICGSGYT